MFIDQNPAFDREQRCCMLLYRHKCHHISHLGVQHLSKYDNTGRSIGTRQCTGQRFASKGSKNVIAAKNHDRLSIFPLPSGPFVYRPRTQFQGENTRGSNHSTSTAVYPPCIEGIASPLPLKSPRSALLTCFGDLHGMAIPCFTRPLTLYQLLGWQFGYRLTCLLVQHGFSPPGAASVPGPLRTGE